MQFAEYIIQCVHRLMEFVLLVIALHLVQFVVVSTTPIEKCHIEVRSWGNDDADDKSGYLKVNGQMIVNTTYTPRCLRGVYLAAINAPKTEYYPQSYCEVFFFYNFDTHGDKNASRDMLTIISTLRQGQILIGFTADEPSQYLRTAVPKLQELGFSTASEVAHSYRSKFIFVAWIGNPEKTKYVIQGGGGSGLELRMEV